MACSTRTDLPLALVILVSLCARAGWAQDDEARAAAALGRKAFEAGDFQAAIRKYEEAQLLKPAPGLLFNLAQSHRYAGNVERAISYFRGYLTTRAPERQARAIEALIQRLQALRLLEVETERLAIEKTRLALVQRQFAMGLCAELPPAPPPITSRWWFWTIIGTAVVGTAVGIAAATTAAGAPAR